MRKSKHAVIWLLCCLLIVSSACAENNWKIMNNLNECEQQIVRVAEEILDSAWKTETTVHTVLNQQDQKRYMVVSCFLPQTNQCVGYAVFDAATMQLESSFYGTSSDFWKLWQDPPMQFWTLEAQKLFADLFMASSTVGHMVALPISTDLTEEEAIQAANQVMKEKYSFTPETLERFRTGREFRRTNNDQALWIISYQEEGESRQYQITLDSQTGKLVDAIKAY